MPLLSKSIKLCYSFDKILRIYIGNPTGIVRCSVANRCAPVCWQPTRSLSSEAKKTSREVVTSRGSDYVSTDVKESVQERVKEAAKTTTYTGVILLGLGVTGALFFAIFSELFSSKSPNNVYTKSFERCINDNRIKDSLGEPIKAFGEETRRGRRRHVSHYLYERDGIPHLRMHFYIKGARQSGTVHLEMKEDSNGNYIYRYLFVQLDDVLRRVIVLEDNRTEKLAQLTPNDVDLNLGSPINFK